MYKNVNKVLSENSALDMLNFENVTPACGGLTRKSQLLYTLYFILKC